MRTEDVTLGECPYCHADVTARLAAERYGHWTHRRTCWRVGVLRDPCNRFAAESYAMSARDSDAGRLRTLLENDWSDYARRAAGPQLGEYRCPVRHRTARPELPDWNALEDREDEAWESARDPDAKWLDDVFADDDRCGRLGLLCERYGYGVAECRKSGRGVVLRIYDAQGQDARVLIPGNECARFAGWLEGVGHDHA